MSLKIHPDGTVELASEEDLRLYQLYQTMHGNGAPVASPAVPVNVDEPAETTAPATPSRKRVKRLRISSEQLSLLKTIKDLQPDAPGRSEISDLLEMRPQRVSEQLAELKRLGLATNGAPPNSWRWQLTSLAETSVDWTKRG